MRAASGEIDIADGGERREEWGSSVARLLMR